VLVADPNHLNLNRQIDSTIHRFTDSPIPQYRGQWSVVCLSPSSIPRHFPNIGAIGLGFVIGTSQLATGNFPTPILPLYPIPLTSYFIWQKTEILFKGGGKMCRMLISRCFCYFRNLDVFFF
jgi:hypothetical protein